MRDGRRGRRKARVDVLHYGGEGSTAVDPGPVQARVLNCSGDAELLEHLAASERSADAALLCLHDRWPAESVTDAVRSMLVPVYVAASDGRSPCPRLSAAAAGVLEFESTDGTALLEAISRELGDGIVREAWDDPVSPPREGQVPVSVIRLGSKTPAPAAPTAAAPESAGAKTAAPDTAPPAGAEQPTPIPADALPSLPSPGNIPTLAAPGPPTVSPTDPAMVRAEKLACLRQLAAGLAHEMNNLVTPMAGYAQLIRSHTQDERVWRKLDIIEGSAFKASEMINDLLAFTRIPALVPRSTPMGPWLEETTAELRERQTTPGIVVDIRVPPSLPELPVDREKLREALDHVVRNACQAMEVRGGTVSIGAKVTVVREEDRERYRITRDRRRNNFFAETSPAVGDSVLVISVADEGPGVDPDAGDRIFYPFFTTRGPDRGRGLGLPVAYGLLQSHGGTLSLVSRPEAGAVCYLVLPAGGAERVGPEADVVEDDDGESNSA